MQNPDGVVVVSAGKGSKSLPLVIKAEEGYTSVNYLKQWMKNNKEWLDSKMLEHGAILIKGFDIDDGVEFESVVQQFCPKLSDEYRGTSPRKLVPGTKYVFTASELPSFYPIPQHLEMSFLPSPPKQLFFCGLEAPTSLGGETCLCDFKVVYDQLDPEVRKEFQDKGVLHIRNYIFKKKLLSDPFMLKGWCDVFGTENKEEVERELKRQEVDYFWGKNNSLHIHSKTAATENHPQTGDNIWFNHLMTFHACMIHQEYYRIWQRLGQLKALLIFIIAWFLSFFICVWGHDNLGMHTQFGDGSTIPEKTIDHIRGIVWKNMVFNRWEKGDLLLIDNFRISHGRQPFSGRRKIVVSWSTPMKRPSFASRADS